MCGRYTQLTDLERLARRFNAKAPRVQLPRRYNLAPGQRAPVVVAHGNGREVRLMQWGLVPPWAKDASVGHKLINARAETLSQKPSFRRAFEHQRCLVPADGFYEWRKKRDSKQKNPLYFVLKNRSLFGFAGLWSVWRRPDGSDLETFTIVTTQANELIQPLHDRMPAMLRPEDEGKWLDFKNRDILKLSTLLTPFPSTQMGGYEVSALVNSPRNDSPECIQAAPVPLLLNI